MSERLAAKAKSARDTSPLPAPCRLARHERKIGKLKAMPPQPLYYNESLQPAYALRFTWTGWLSGDASWSAKLDSLREQLAALWETDGMRPLEWSTTADAVQVCFSARPDVSPILLAQHAKGRIQHALDPEQA